MIVIMETRNENIRPYKPVHPGHILKEELKSRNIKQKDLATEINMQPTHLSSLINGRRNMSADTALKLEHSLGIPASFWMSLQNAYELDCKFQNHGSTECSDNKMTISVTIPSKDKNLLRDLVEKFGWVCVF